MEYTLTNFNIPVSGSPSYINTQSKPNLAVNETLLFNMSTGVLKSFMSYTAEMYGRLPGYYLQRQFLGFKQGVPYIFHGNLASAVAPPAYCNFFGVQCEVRVTHIVNGIDGKNLPDKVKRYLWEEIYCRQTIPGPAGTWPTALFYCDNIVSEKGQVSRLLAGRWKIADGYQSASFLCDINTPVDPNMPADVTANPILDGNPLQGRYLLVSTTNNNSWTGTYFELSEKVDYINGVEKTPE